MMESDLVKKQPKPAVPTRNCVIRVDKALLDEYEKVFKKTIWVERERAMLLEQYMKDRLANYYKNHPKR